MKNIIRNLTILFLFIFLGCSDSNLEDDSGWPFVTFKIDGIEYEWIAFERYQSFSFDKKENEIFDGYGLTFYDKKNESPWVYEERYDSETGETYIVSWFDEYILKKKLSIYIDKNKYDKYGTYKDETSLKYYIDDEKYIANDFTFNYKLTGKYISSMNFHGEICTKELECLTIEEGRVFSLKELPESFIDEQEDENEDDIVLRQSLLVQ